jgi:hypothetical protein
MRSWPAAEIPVRSSASHAEPGPAQRLSQPSVSSALPSSQRSTSGQISPSPHADPEPGPVQSALQPPQAVLKPSAIVAGFNAGLDVPITATSDAALTRAGVGCDEVAVVALLPARRVQPAVPAT